MADAVVRRVIELDVKQSAEALQAIRSMQQSLKGVEDVAKSTQQNLSGFTSALSGIGGKVAGLGLVVSGFKEIGSTITSTIGTVFSFTRAVAETQRSVELLRNGFTAVRGGDTRQSGEDLEYIRQTASKLGLEFNNAAKSYLQLVATTRGTNLEGNGTREIFENVASAAAKMGVGTEATGRAFNALQQILSKGRVQQEELRGQLAEALPGSLQIAARAFGVTTSELNNMVTSGIEASEFVSKFSAQLSKEFAGAGSGLGKATAALAEFDSQWEQLKQSLAEGGAGDAAAGQLNILSDAFKDITNSIRRAKEEGDGFFGQTAAAAGGALRFLNPVNAFSYTAQDPTARIGQLQGELGAVPANERSLTYSTTRQRELNKLLDEQNKLKREAADIDRQRSPNGLDVQSDQANKAREQFSLLSAEYTKKETKQKTELAQLEALYKANGTNTEGYNKLRAAIIDKYKETDKDAEAYKRVKESADQFLNSIDKQTRARLIAIDGNAIYRDSLKEEAAGLEQLAKLRGRDADIFRKQLTEKVAGLRSAEAAQSAFNAARGAEQEDRARLDGYDAEIQKIKDQTAAIGQGKDVEELLKAARLDSAEATARLNVNEAIRDGATQERIASLQSEVEKVEQLRDAYLEKGRAEVRDKDRKTAEQEAKSEAESFQRILETSITNTVRAGSGGKGFASNLFESLKAGLQSQAIKVLIEPETKLVSQAMQQLAKQGQDLFKNLFDQLIQANSNGQGLSGFLTQLFNSFEGGGGGDGGGGGLFGGLSSLFGGGGGGGGDTADYAQYAQIAAYFFAAKGAVMEGGSPKAFAKGGVFNSPHMFPMADGGSGLLGEAGPEAIMPLTRGPDGKLGVKNSEGGDTSGIVVNITNTSTSQVTARETKGPNGGRQLEIMVSEMVNKGITSGTYDRALNGVFGVSRKGRA